MDRRDARSAEMRDRHAAAEAVSLSPAPSPIGVVIPYFQRESGLLQRAIASVSAQTVLQDRPVRLVIIDDGAPQPSEDEMADFQPPAGLTLIVVQTANGGVAAARNRGLIELGLDCEFVAFLDSDDVWADDHLQHALEGLGSEFDFFFCDHSRDGAYASYFHTIRFEPQSSVTVRNGPPQAKVRVLNDAFSSILRGYLAQTSTVVLRRAVIGDLWFDEDLRFAGEDHLFWLRVAARTSKIVFSDVCSVRCGAGVSIYHGALSWDHPSSLVRLSDRLSSFHKAKSELPCKAADRTFIAMKRQRLEQQLCFLWLRHRIVGNSPVALPASAGFSLRRSPGRFLGRLGHIALLSALGRYRSLDE